MVLLAIGASVVFSIVSPPDPAPSSSLPRRPTSAAARPTPKPAISATVQSAASSAETGLTGCYPYSRAWVSGNMNIRGRPSTTAALLGSTPPGESYEVVGSRQGDVYCWIDIDLGWIAVTEYVSAHKPQAPAREPAPDEAVSSPPDSAPAAVDAAVVQQALATLNGLVVAPENRCSPYDSDDYRYPQSVEAEIVRGMGGRIYGPYTGTTFSSTRETDIEHIVAKSEAHDSGLCAVDEGTRKVFARDLLNLTLASPSLNRHQKRAKDFAEWKPALNVCWFADRIIKVKAKYSLTIDSREKAALRQTLGSCSSADMR